MPTVSLRILLSLSLTIVGVTSLKGQLGYNDLVDATIAILGNCSNLSEDSEETLLLAGEYNDFLKRNLYDIKPVTLVAQSKHNELLDNFTLTKYSFREYMKYDRMYIFRKAHRFIIVTSSQPLLRSVLQKIKDSPWANADGFYILIDKQTEKRGCANAYSYLWSAWDYDLISVVFLCIDPKDGLFYYTYNPYSREKPPSWREVGHYKGRENHPWIILKKKFVSDGPEMCKELNFDKTTILDNYVIRVNAIQMEPFLRINPNETGINRFSGDDAEILKTVFNQLKVSPKVTVNQGTIYELGHVNDNGTLTGMFIPLSNGRIDVGMNTRSLFAMWKLRFTYPHSRSGLCVMTQSSRQVSEFSKLLAFLSTPVWTGIFITCLLTYVVFMRKEGYVLAALEMVRLVICVAILHPPKINSIRIFLCTVFILFLHMNILFQSRWWSLLTVPIYHRTIVNWDDVKNYGYKIYGSKPLQAFLNDQELRSRYNIVSYEACKKYVENSSDAACTGDCSHLNYRIRNGDFYKSKTLRDMTLTYITRENWPLFGRVDRIIQRMVQTGLVRKFRIDVRSKFKREKKMKEEKNKSFKVMSLSQLTFGFYILGIGYTCAAVTFAVEMIVGKRVGKQTIETSEKKKKRNGKNAKFLETFALNRHP